MKNKVPHELERITLSWWQMLLLAMLGVTTLFLWEGNKGFGLSDEGYLWYGVQRVMAREVPMRDFQSYDPGRYYWSAGIMSLLGSNGIIALRISVAVFQMFGLFVGLILISKTGAKKDFYFILLSALILMLWMYPRHKLYDISISIFLIGSLALLLEKPIQQNYFVAGFSIGLAAVFGRNHGIYGSVGLLSVFVWITVTQGNNKQWADLLKNLIWGSAGVVSGFLPILLMMLLVPNFANAFWESILFLFEVKSTNLPVPVPWPWGAIGLPIYDAIRKTLIGLFFIVIVIVPVVAIIWVVQRKFRGHSTAPVILAATFLTLPYAHHAYSRADVAHLAQSIFPFMVGCLAFLSTCSSKIKWSLASLLGGVSIWLMMVTHPGWQNFVSKQWVTVDVSSNRLKVSPAIANDIAMLRKVADQYAPGNQSILVTPFWPGAYALLERKSSMWESFSLFKRTKSFEQSEIQRIKVENPGLVLILNSTIDERDEMRFKNNRPLIYQYILSEFTPIPFTENPNFQLFEPKKKVNW